MQTHVCILKVRTTLQWILTASQRRRCANNQMHNDAPDMHTYSHVTTLLRGGDNHVVAAFTRCHEVRRWPLHLWSLSTNNGCTLSATAASHLQQQLHGSDEAFTSFSYARKHECHLR